jgi:hypothetical protein
MIEVGQKLWFVPYESNRNPPFEVEVVKVGVKFVTVARFRGDTNGLRLVKDSLQEDNTSGGRAYVSQEAYDNWLSLQRAWGSLREAMYGRMPRDITMERIKEAREILYGRPAQSISPGEGME